MAVIPLQADPSLLRQAERQSFVRACATLVLGTKGGIERTDQVFKHWRDDMAGRIVKAAQLPTDTGDFPQL